MATKAKAKKEPVSPLLKQHPIIMQAAVQDLLAAVWELQDLTRQVSVEARNLSDIIKAQK